MVDKVTRSSNGPGPLCKAAVGSIHRTIDLKFTHVVSNASNYSRCHIIDCSGAETLTFGIVSNVWAYSDHPRSTVHRSSLILDGKNQTSLSLATIVE